MPTQNEVDKEREEVEALRAKVREQRTSNSQTADERTREIQMDRLKDERQRLEAELALTGEARDERNAAKAKEHEELAEDDGVPTPISSAPTTPQRPTTPTPSAPTGTTNDDKQE